MIALFLVFLQPRQSEFLEQLVHLLINIRSRPVHGLSKFIHRVACRKLDLALSRLAVPKSPYVVAVESKALEIRELRSTAEILDGEEFGKRKVAKIAGITYKLDVAFWRRIDVNHADDENLSRTARLRVFGKWLSVLNCCNLILA